MKYTSCLYITGAYAIIIASIFLFPGVPLVPTLLKLTGLGALVLFLNRQITGSSAMTDRLLLAAWTLLSVGLVVNVWYFTTYSGGTIYDPVLLNDDANTAWTRMAGVLSGSDTPQLALSRRGYGTFLALLAWPARRYC